MPRQLACLSDYSDLIAGTLDSVAAVRARGITTGDTPREARLARGERP